MTNPRPDQETASNPVARLAWRNIGPHREDFQVEHRGATPQFEYTGPVAMPTTMSS